MYRRPKCGEIYRHFKDKLYQIVTIAKHSETLENMVVYKHLGSGEYWARPEKMFLEDDFPSSFDTLFLLIFFH